MIPLGLPMVPFVPTFLLMVKLAPMVPLAAETSSGFSGYKWYIGKIPNGTIGRIPNTRNVTTIPYKDLIVSIVSCFYNQNNTSFMIKTCLREFAYW